MRRMHLIIVGLLLLLSACNLSSEPPTEEPIEIPTEQDQSGRPSVSITSPQQGAEVVVGTQVLVTATATDTVGVTRMQLIANNQIVKTIVADASGQKNFQGILDYTPRQAGEVELQVLAYRGAIASDPAVIDIVVKSQQAATSPPVSGGGGGSTSGPVIDPNDPTCRALINTGLRLRTGPGTNFDIIRTLAAGSVIPIVGRVSNNTWWQLQQGLTVGWVSAEFTSVYGICTAVPVVNAPPTPTTTPATATTAPTIPPSATPRPSITPTPGRPDLVISSIVGPSTTTVAASPVPYSVTITNTGTGPSGPFYARVTQPNGVEQNLDIIPNLNAGESITLTVDINFTTTGNALILFRADAGEQVNEVSEVNNTGTIQVSVS